MTRSRSSRHPMLLVVVLAILCGLFVAPVAQSQVAEVGLRAEILSCDGKKLNGYKALKDFLITDEEVHFYDNVKVTFEEGATPIMTIFEDGEEREKVLLRQFSTKLRLHTMMTEKGFRRNSANVMEIMERKREETLREQEGEEF